MLNNNNVNIKGIFKVFIGRHKRHRIFCYRRMKGTFISLEYANAHKVQCKVNAAFAIIVQIA